MHIVQFHIENLFGDLKHTISLKPEGLTFIHGPNGCGKTTVLRMIHIALEGRFTALRTIPFSYMDIQYDDDRLLRISRDEQVQPQAQGLFYEPDEAPRSRTKLSIELLTGKHRVLHKFDPNAVEASEVEQRISPPSVERFLPFLTRIGPRRWQDTRSGESISFEQVVERYCDLLPGTQAKLPDWLISRILPKKTVFVKTQRLIHIAPSQKSYRGDEGSETRDVVKLYSDQIKDTIEKKLAESAVQSQVRDRSFPTRLLERQFPQNITQIQIEDLYKSTQERAQNLMNAGLLDQADQLPLPSRKINKMEREVLALYLSDFDDKLNAFTDLQQHIEALVEIVGNKLRRKRFSVDRKKGFVFEPTHGSAKDLKVTDLSSGEQHQLVLFYELIFASEGSSIYFIDEPEISWHVEWQRKFIDDILKIQKLTGAIFLVATHSPQIINNRRDLAVPLDGGISLDSARGA